MLAAEGSAAFEAARAKSVDSCEKFKVLSVTGGIAGYLGAINPARPAEHNIRTLCFAPGGFLVDELSQIFSLSSSGVFMRNSEDYRLITAALTSGPKQMQEIHELLQRHAPGSLPAYLRELELAGFVSRDYSWNLLTGEAAASGCATIIYASASSTFRPIATRSSAAPMSGAHWTGWLNGRAS